MNKLERVQIAVPTGDLGKPVMTRLSESGLEFDVVTKRNFVTVKNLGVDMVLIRPSSVPDLVMHKRPKPRAGLTGGDIVWERMGKDQGTRIPTIPNDSTLFIGVTKPLRERVLADEGREPTADDLMGSTVVTKFPRIAENIFGDTVDIWPMPGSTEALQYAVDGANGILDITATGEAVEANQLTIVERLMEPVDVRMIYQHGLTPLEERIIADFRGVLLGESRISPDDLTGVAQR